VPYPCLSIHVRSVGMAAFVTEVAIRFHGMRRAPYWRRPTPWNRLMPSAARFFMLCKRWNCKNKQCSKCYRSAFHTFLRMPSGRAAFAAALSPWWVIPNNSNWNPEPYCKLRRDDSSWVAIQRSIGFRIPW
jgi:hypothetical protein